MAIVKQTPDGDAAAKVTAPEARQGQNVKGMLAVLGIGILLVVIAYAVMLALSSQPVTPAGMPTTDAPAATAPETAQSPN